MEGITSFFKATKAAVLNIPEIEQKVLEATNNEKWGPTGPQMKEISQASFQYNDFPIIMQIIWKRVAERIPEKWRHVYKALLLLDYMIRNGTEQVISNCQIHMMALQSLLDYSSFEGSEDRGISVRERARHIIDLLHDDNRLREEREKAAANRQKFQVSIEGGGGYGGGGNSWNSNGGGYSGSNSSGGYGGYSGNSTGGYGDYSDRQSTSPYSDHSNNYNPSSYSPAASGYENQDYSSGSSSRVKAYEDSRPTKARRDRYENDFISDEEEEDEDEEYVPVSQQKPKQQQQHQTATTGGSARPRAPSGGAASIPQPAKPAAPLVDLLSLGDFSTPAPQTNSSFGQFTQPQQQQPQQQAFGQPQLQQPQPQPSQQAFFPSSTSQLPQQTSFQSQPQQAGFGAQQNFANWGDFSGAPQHSSHQPQLQPPQQQPAKPSVTVQPAKPVLSETDSKDPWKKGADLFSLDSLGMKNDKPVQPVSTGQKIPLNMMGHNNQYANLRDNTQFKTPQQQQQQQQPFGHPQMLTPQQQMMMQQQQMMMQQQAYNAQQQMMMMNPQQQQQQQQHMLAQAQQGYNPQLMQQNPYQQPGSFSTGNSQLRF